MTFANVIARQLKRLRRAHRHDTYCQYCFGYPFHCCPFLRCLKATVLTPKRVNTQSIAPTRGRYTLRR
ncbi:hypothetical protein L1D14_26900 [Vibrio tubiashii]|nr:hypothetical protein [Vibrio tubiashii]